MKIYETVNYQNQFDEQRYKLLKLKGIKGCVLQFYEKKIIKNFGLGVHEICPT